MKDEDIDAFNGQRLEGGIHTAVELWCDDPAAAKAQYGPIASWDTSEITDMRGLFVHKVNFMLQGATSFNGDLSLWDVSKVSNMSFMFWGATSFTHQLGGAWSTSTATKYAMFGNCPGSIVGKTNDGWGTPV